MILRELADDGLYRRNAFRVTGLPVDAGPRVVRERQKRETAAAAVGLATSTDEVRAAYEVLADPQRRLVHELFWLWGPDTSACGCESHAHRVHDEAVARHAAALDRELAGEEADWPDVREAWASTAAAAGTWDHLRARVDVLDDARLEASTVDALRDELPRALVATVIARATEDPAPERLRAEAERWPLDADALADVLLDAVAGPVAAIEATLTESRGLLDADPREAARLLRPGVVAELARVEALAPHERFPRLADLREDTAILLNNAALRVVERGRDGDLAEAFGVLADAEALATTHRTREAIVRNRAEARRSPAPPAADAHRRVDTGGPSTPATPRWMQLVGGGAATIVGLTVLGGLGVLAVAIVLDLIANADDVLDTGITLGLLLGTVVVVGLGLVVGGVVLRTVAEWSAAGVAWWRTRHPERTPWRRRPVACGIVAALPFVAGAAGLGVGTGSIVLAAVVAVAGVLVTATVVLEMTS